MIYALVNELEGVVENSIVLDSIEDYQVAEGCLLIESDASIGTPYVNGEIVIPPVEPVPESFFIKQQIAELEASVTSRRIRESIISTTGKNWLKAIDDQISVLRSQL